MTDHLRPRTRLTSRSKRVISRSLATAALGAGILTVPLGGSPANAVCTSPGGMGWDVSPLAGGVSQYSLIAYFGAGCTVGVVDMEAVAVPGTPATCTFILPVIPTITDGTGCANLLGVGGVAVGGTITGVANGFVSDGINTRTIAKTCQHTAVTWRCSFSS